MLVPVPARPVVALLLVLATLGSGCSADDDCRGQTYDVDLGAGGAATPIRALDEWLRSDHGFDKAPPGDGWVEMATDDRRAAAVVITNDAGSGWWVQTARTDTGGYVVAQATDVRESCGDELS